MNVMVGEFLGHGRHGIHVAERGGQDQVEALAGQAADDLLGVGAFGHVFDVGDVRVRHVLLEVGQAVVVRLAPAAVVMRADQDRGDVELALLDIRDLQAGLRSRGRGRGGAQRVLWSARLWPREQPGPVPVPAPARRRRRSSREQRGGRLRPRADW